MANLHKLPTWNDEGQLVCVVESPRGARAKFEFDPALKVFTLNRALILGIAYPYDWGFIPSTMAEDGDPLDVMVFHDTPTFPGVVMACDPIGALLVTQKKWTARRAGSRTIASSRCRRARSATSIGRTRANYQSAFARSSRRSSSPRARSPTRSFRDPRLGRAQGGQRARQGCAEAVRKYDVAVGRARRKAIARWHGRK